MNENNECILMLRLNIEDGKNQLFEHWHNQEHIPMRMKVPGFITSQRYYCPQTNEYLCYYRLQNSNVLDSEVYIEQNEGEHSKLSNEVSKYISLNERNVLELLWSKSRAVGSSLILAQMSLDASQLSISSESIEGKFSNLLQENSYCSARLLKQKNDQGNENITFILECAGGDYDYVNSQMNGIVKSLGLRWKVIRFYNLQCYFHACIE